MRHEVFGRVVIELFEPGSLLLADGNELVPPLMQGGQLLAGRIRSAIGAGPQTLRHRRQHPRIDRVGLGEHAGGAGEIAGAGRIDARELDACGT